MWRHLSALKNFKSDSSMKICQNLILTNLFSLIRIFNFKVLSNVSKSIDRSGCKSFIFNIVGKSYSKLCWQKIWTNHTYLLIMYKAEFMLYRRYCIKSSFSCYLLFCLGGQKLTKNLLWTYQNYHQTADLKSVPNLILSWLPTMSMSISKSSSQLLSAVCIHFQNYWKVNKHWP